MNEYQSKNIINGQAEVHKNLQKIVKKHIDCDYKKPMQQHNVVAVETLKKVIAQQKKSELLLDSCCGTGLSSIALAKMYPDSLVVGVDQSGVRLSKDYQNIVRPPNLLLLQTNCEDFWRLCVEENICFDQHTILYPNPWPKSEHFKRRWHGHPVFPWLAKISPKTHLRSNWSLYLHEFSCAWAVLTERRFEVQPLSVTEPLTLFERKYSASGQPLYQLTVEA